MRQDSEAEFYNADTEEQACRALEAFWPHAHRFGTSGGKRPAEDIRDIKQVCPELWRGDISAGFLGIRPILWTLLILCRYDNERLVTINSLRPNWGENIYHEGNPNQNGTALPAEKEIVVCLRLLILKGQVRGYNETLDVFYFLFFATRIMKDWYERTATPCPSKKELLEKIHQVWRELSEKRPQSIKEALAVVRGLLPDRARYKCAPNEVTPTQDFSRGKHLISEGLWAYVGGEYAKRPNPTEPRKTATSILEHLLAKRAVLLHGPVNSGKSSVVVEVLRALAQKSQGNTVQLSVPGGDLPVCVINVRAHSDREVALRVLAFLEFMEPKYNRTEFKRVLSDLELQFGGNDRINDQERLFERLGEACKARPGFFVFTNWDDQGDSLPRSLMRDQSKSGLIRLLHDGHNMTRVLLSTLGTNTGLGRRKLSTLPSMVAIEVKDPVFSQLNRYWLGLEINDAAQRRAVERLNSLIGPEARIPGAHLMLIAVLIQLTACHDSRFSNEEALRPLMPTLETYVSAVNDSKDRLDRLQEPARALVRAFLAELNRQNLLRIVLAIASPDDGLRPESLKNVLSDWAAQSGRPLARKTPLEDVDGILVRLASNFFIIKTPSADRNGAQLNFGEVVGPRDEQYELNQTLREMIFNEIFHEQNNGLQLEDGQPTCVQWCREAQRHVATRARLRGRNWRLNARMATLTRNWRDYLPDIQAYESLLASLDPDAISTQSVRPQSGPTEALAHREMEVFQQAKDYDHRLALRFAVNCLLRSEIDRDGRLTMLYDQDDLRKKLCLAPFLELGRKHFVGASELGPVVRLPEKLPAHILATFLPSEIVDILTSVALAAFHSQCSATLNWAKARFDELLSDAAAGDRKKLLNRGVRILCSTYDMSIMRGGPIWIIEGVGGNHGETLSQLRALLASKDDNLAVFGEINALFGNTSDPEFGANTIANGITILRSCLQYNGDENTKPPFELDSETLVSWLRIKVREATLLDCLGHKDTALMIYDAVHRVEALVGELQGDAQSLVLDGRLARDEIFALLNSPAFQRQGQGETEKRYEATERRINSLMSANVARLSRFGGAEQAATLIALALFEALRRDRDLESAMRLAKKSRNAVENDQASLGMHSQIIVTQILINLQVLKRDAKKLSKSRLEARAKELLKDTELLLRIAEDGLEQRPMAARAYALKGEIWKLMIEYLGEQAAVFEAQAALEKAIRLLSSAQHTLYDVDVRGMLKGLNRS